MRPKLSQITLTACCWALLFVTSPPAPAAPHPKLVNIEDANCGLCHDDLLPQEGVIHGATEDCTICHAFTISADGTSVELAEPEPSLCLFCHDAQSAAAEMKLEASHAPVGDSCLTCHQPHASPNASLLTAPQPDLCGDCHDLAGLKAAHGNQLTGATRCAGCHPPHGSNNPTMLKGSRLHAPFEDGGCNACHRAPFGDRIRLRSRGDRLCQACHGDVTEGAGADGSVHAALETASREASCLACHDAHLSDQPDLLLKESQAVCAGCHADLVAGAIADTGHLPAADDCATCHLPHASPQAHLLTDDAQALCAACHDLDDEALQATHLGADLTTLTCTSCHSPHGAGQPKLLAATYHEALEGGCDTCHEGGHDELYEDGGAELCLMCHDEIRELADNAEFPHGGMNFDSCTVCHNPHASAQRKLAKLPAGGACFECHDDKEPGPGEVAHGIIDLIGCEGCHEPHGGRNEKLLRLTGADLCLACHAEGAVPVAEGDEKAVFLDRFEVPAVSADGMRRIKLSADGEHGHPAVDHRVLGTPTEAELANVETTFSGELTCSVCHDPHKGRSSKILRWDAASAFEACQACHPK